VNGVRALGAFAVDYEERVRLYHVGEIGEGVVEGVRRQAKRAGDMALGVLVGWAGVEEEGEVVVEGSARVGEGDGGEAFGKGDRGGRDRPPRNGPRGRSKLLPNGGSREQRDAAGGEVVDREAEGGTADDDGDRAKEDD
jgi:hypothetical protein